MDLAARQARIKWFQDARFGMFIHWGLYAIPARGEWVRSFEAIPHEDYALLKEEFNPTEYDPKEWAQLAREAGMQYAVLTAKHHDGFCLFDTALTDFKSTNSPCKRDLVREYVEAFRAEGLKVGLYYSLLDWRHPDYPAYQDDHHPLKKVEGAHAGGDFNRYLDFLHGQVRELMTNYGKIDLLWLDFSYGNLTGEAWRATELVRMVRSLQPHILMNSRLDSSGESYGGIMSDNPGESCGDFTCPEMIIPAQGLRSPSGQPVPWECCTTLNNHWGYCAADHEYKTPGMVIRKLVECVSKGGNMILNVGPTAKGVIPEESADVLREVGAWMKLNGESIYGCGPSDLPKPEWGRLTQKGDTVYCHVMDQPIGPLCLPGLRGKAEQARIVADGAEAYIVDTWVTRQFKDDLFISVDRGGVDTIVLPDQDDFVVKFRLKP